MTSKVALHAGYAAFFFALGLAQLFVDWQSFWLAFDVGFMVFNIVAAINADAEY